MNFAHAVMRYWPLSLANQALRQLLRSIIRLRYPPMTKLTLPQERRQPCEIWTRVMGYHRPVHAFNRGKQAEYRERQPFTEPKPTAHA